MGEALGRPRPGRPGPEGVLRNSEGGLSGAKLVLLTACLLAVAWLGRDLLTGRELGDSQTALLGLLLISGLINRISARGRFRLRLGRDGAEVEGGGPHQEY